MQGLGLVASEGGSTRAAEGLWAGLPRTDWGGPRLRAAWATGSSASCGGCPEEAGLKPAPTSGRDSDGGGLVGGIGCCWLGVGASAGSHPHPNLLPQRDLCVTRGWLPGRPLTPTLSPRRGIKSDAALRRVGMGWSWLRGGPLTEFRRVRRSLPLPQERPLRNLGAVARKTPHPNPLPQEREKERPHLRGRGGFAKVSQERGRSVRPRGGCIRRGVPVREITTGRRAGRREGVS